MSLLKYLSRVDPCYHDSQLPDPNGRLARAVPSSAISVANESVNVCVYHETHCRCGSLERTCGRANGTAKFFNENFVDSYPRNLSSAKLRRYTVWEYNVADGVFLWPSSSIVQVSWNRKTANNKITWLTNCENEDSIIWQYTLTCMECIHHSRAAFDTLGTVHIVFAFDALHPNSAVALDSVLVSFPPDSVVASF